MLALETAPTRHRLWKRYVDDTFYILRKGSTEELLHHLNGIRPTIKFTVEQENGTLPFLDTLLRRREDGNLDVSVYRKPTHTDRYLQFESYHPTHAKRGVVRCLHDRARRVISTQDNLLAFSSRMVIPRASSAMPLPNHTGNSRRKQLREGTGEGTSGGDTLHGWDE